MGHEYSNLRPDIRAFVKNSWTVQAKPQNPPELEKSWGTFLLLCRAEMSQNEYNYS
jgi:hypothetical protein